MLSREDFRYSKTWVRIICSCFIASLFAFLMYFGALARIEASLAEAVAPEMSLLYGRVPLFLQVGVIFLFGVLIGLPRIRYPFLLIIYVAILLAIYTACVIGVIYLFDSILPLSAPLLTVSLSAALLGSIAWSEEQYDRLHLQDLEKMHQQLTDMIVHDLKKKLSSVTLSISMLQKENPSADEDEMLTTLKHSTEQMLLLVTNLLDIRKFEVGRMSIRSDTVSLKELLLKSIEEHKAISDLLGITIHCLAAEDTAVSADRQMMSRVVMNLVWNAIQHAPQGSEVEVNCGMDDATAFVRVANRGDVIPIDLQKHLFTPFSAGPRPPLNGMLADSTGLGLAFCKLAVEAHGGSIDLESPWKKHGDGVAVSVSFSSPPAALQ